MNQILIRKATIHDLNSLAILFDGYRVFYEKSSDISLARDFLKARIENNESTIFVAVINERLVAFTQLYPIFSSVSAKRLLLLNDLYVYPDHRNQRIASLLLERAKQYAIDIGAKGLTLETGKDNPAQKLYERLGWKQDQGYLHYYINVES